MLVVMSRPDFLHISIWTLRRTVSEDPECVVESAFVNLRMHSDPNLSTRSLHRKFDQHDEMSLRCFDGTAAKMAPPHWSGPGIDVALHAEIEQPCLSKQAK